MRIRAVDENNDWEFGKGKNSYKVNQEAVKQNIKTRIFEWVGDCFFAADAGIDWKNRLEKNQQAPLELEIKSLILRSEGVVQLTEIAAIFTGRVLSVSYSILSIFSPSIQRIIIKEEIANG